MRLVTTYLPLVLLLLSGAAVANADARVINASRIVRVIESAIPKNLDTLTSAQLELAKSEMQTKLSKSFNGTNLKLTLKVRGVGRLVSSHAGANRFYISYEAFVPNRLAKHTQFATYQTESLFVVLPIEKSALINKGDSIVVEGKATFENDKLVGGHYSPHRLLQIHDKTIRGKSNRWVGSLTVKVTNIHHRKAGNIPLASAPLKPRQTKQSEQPQRK